MSGAIHLNGIDGVTGQRAVPPLHPERFAQLLLGRLLAGGAGAGGAGAAAALAAALPAALPRALRSDRHAADDGPRPPAADADELARHGGGVVFPSDGDPAVREALRPLLDLRRRQASAGRGVFYHEFAGAEGCRPGEDKRAFLNRLGIEPGPTDPSRLPYYLLLVGSPAQIPFRFQEQMRARHSVGRLDLADADACAHYARNVVAVETGARPRPRGAAFFATSHDEPTRESEAQLVRPLADLARDLTWRPPVATRFGFEANRQGLVDLLSGAERPALLFAAGHGLCFPEGHPQQASRQGALVCPDAEGRPLNDPAQTFAGADAAAIRDLTGLVTFLFACFGAGTPRMDDFAVSSPGAVARGTIAPAPFVADLPRRLLGRPDGALCVIGHVDRAWNFSFQSLLCYRRLVRRLLSGHTVGHAMEPLNWRYLDLSSDLSVLLEDQRFGTSALNNVELAIAWATNNDARDLVVFGDPAVRAVTPGQS